MCCEIKIEYNAIRLNASQNGFLFTHNASPIAILTLAGTVLEESVDLYNFGVTINDNMAFEKVKSRRVVHNQSLLVRRFRGFVLHVFEYCSMVWCWIADKNLRLFDRAVSGASSLAGAVVECNFSNHRPVSVLYLRYKIRNNSMYPLCGTSPVPLVPVQVIRAALVAHLTAYRTVSLQVTRVKQDFHTSLSISLGRSWWDWLATKSRLIVSLAF